MKPWPLRRILRERPPETSVEAFRRADRYRHVGRYVEALELVAHGLALDPNNVTGHLLAAYLHHAARTLDAARGEFRWVLARDPHHARALLGLARLALEEQDVDGCRELLGRALGYYRDFPEAQALMDAMAGAREPAAEAATADVATLERLRLPAAARALLVARHEGHVLVARPPGAHDAAAADTLVRLMRLAAATLGRSGLGPVRRALLEDDADTQFVRTDGDLLVALVLPRTMDVTQGLLEVNRVWAGALHELGLASGAPTPTATPSTASSSSGDSRRRAS
jgi:tetratricopeptide (TPR) repeat protein